MTSLIQLLAGTYEVSPTSVQNYKKAENTIESVRINTHLFSNLTAVNSTIRSSNGRGLYNSQIAFFGASGSTILGFSYGHKPDINGPVGVRCSCFTGDTLVMTPNGYSVSIKDFDMTKTPYVYSYDLNSKKVVIGKVTNSGLTRKNAKIVKVTLDNGKSVRCTDDHQFLTKDGRYMEAKDLVFGTSLMAAYRKTYDRDIQLGYKYGSMEKVMEKSSSYLNHKVISVEDDGYEDVYCLTIPEYENFCIDVDEGIDCSSGIFVHNCANYYYCFSYANTVRGCSYGARFAPYVRKTPLSDPRYPPKNPNNIPGVCKHLILLQHLLPTMNLYSKAVNTRPGSQGIPPTF